MVLARNQPDPSPSALDDGTIRTSRLTANVLKPGRHVKERLDTLEHTVAELARELRVLRAVVDTLENNARVSPPRPSEPSHAMSRDAGAGMAGFAGSEVPRIVPPPEPRPVPIAPPPERREFDRRFGPGRRSIDFEALIGRYGTLALASLTILLGVGAFLGWAIQQNKIGPEMRVMLGAVAAAALAAAGWRLRARGSTRFGSVLLALALAVVHVDAWGAGPYLHLVPSPVALGVAALASVALAVLAWRGDEEALFTVGVGGALIAPFVTSSESGSVPALLLYGYVVLASGLTALKGRPWRTAVTVAALGGWLYTGAATAATGRSAPMLERDLPAAFAIALAWTALLVTRGRWGARVARSALVALVGALAGALLVTQLPSRLPATDLLVLAALGTVSAYAVVHVGEAGRRWAVFTAAVLPLTLGVIAVGSVRDTATARALIAAAWTAAALVAARVQPDVRPTHLMVAGITSAAALLFALEGQPVASCVALSAHAAALSALLRRERQRAIGVPIVLDLLVVTLWTFELLSDRARYTYTPFLTRESLAGLAMAAAWLVVSWNASRVEYADGRGGALETRTMLRLAGAAVTFFWGHAELSAAYSADVSTFLLIAYYATVGIAAIFIGRRRGIPVLRHVGLALAIFAALKAIGEASSLAIGIRVGSYLLAGLYLLAVAYWYRDSGTGNREQGTERGTEQ